MEQAGYPEHERHKTMLGTGMFFTRIKAVAVAEPARGNHLGSWPGPGERLFSREQPAR